MRHKTLKGKSIATRLMRTAAASSPSIRTSKDLKLTWARVCVRSTTVTCLCRPGSMHSLTPGLRVAGCRKPGDWGFLQRKFFPCGLLALKVQSRSWKDEGANSFLPRGYSAPRAFTHTLFMGMLTALLTVLKVTVLVAKSIKQYVLDWLWAITFLCFVYFWENSLSS